MLEKQSALTHYGPVVLSALTRQATKNDGALMHQGTLNCSALTCHGTIVLSALTHQANKNRSALERQGTVN